MELRPEVQFLAEQMESALREHDGVRGKDGWKAYQPRYLLQRLRDEVREVAAEFRYRRSHTPEQRQQVIKECADVANFAMMIADLMNKPEVE